MSAETPKDPHTTALIAIMAAAAALVIFSIGWNLIKGPPAAVSSNAPAPSHHR